MCLNDILRMLREDGDIVESCNTNKHFSHERIPHESTLPHPVVAMTRTGSTIARERGDREALGPNVTQKHNSTPLGATAIT